MAGRVAVWMAGMRPNEARDDVELVEACLRGESEAWEILVRRYAGLVYSVPRRYGLDEDDTADVFQNTWAALWEGLEELRDRRRIAPWLVVVAGRLSYRQVQRRRREFGRHGSDAALEERPDPGALPEDQALAHDEAASLVRAMNRLPDRCRGLLEALFYDPAGPSYAQIAERLGMASDSIGPLRKRCLEHLRQLMTDGYER